LVVLIFAFGLYPSPFLKVVHRSANSELQTNVSLSGVEK
jgi:hypothetical protein